MQDLIIDIETFLKKRSSSLVIDVRAPAEYKQGHIPQAINIPLFSDEERKAVGTKYVQVSRLDAVIAGLDFVGPKMSAFVNEIKKIYKNKILMVYCWRGGMRSEAMCFILKIAGFNVLRLNKGYKAYRNYIHQSFEKKARLIVLGGMTGSGKTAILKELKKQNHQVLDLENIAQHKGSAFGSIDQPEQPSTEQFENNLYEIWKNFDLNKAVWIEDESMDIGKVRLPYSLYQAIRTAPVIKLDVNRELRAKRLVEEYAGNDAELKQAFEKIKKRIGGQNLQDAYKAIDEKNYKQAAMIALQYYDKTYTYGISKRKSITVYNTHLISEDNTANTKKIIEFAKLHFPDLF